MSAQSSNLSNSAYKYDLVSAVTQDALNANLKPLLDAAGEATGPITAYYKFPDPGHTQLPVLMTQEEVEQMTGGLDIFEIMDDGTTNTTGTPQQVELGNTMAGMNFAYAFSVTLGMPCPPADAPDIITLSYTPDAYSSDDIAQTVQYTQYFKTFQAMKLAYSWNMWTVQEEQQTPDNLWIFQWLVDLNLQRMDSLTFDQLPQSVQNNLRRVYNITPQSMFSLQQLLLDLNTTQLINGADPSVVGFPPTDQAYTLLNAFINNYWLVLINNGGITFSSSVTPSNPSDYPPSSLTPTALSFVVSPYTTDPSKKGLYTLNYLVMSDDNAFPSTIQPFNWNWVDDKSIQGIMSVRRDIFLKYLNDVLSPSLTPLCQNVSVNVDKEFLSKPTIDFSLSQSSNTPRYTQNTNNPALTFNFNSKSNDSFVAVQVDAEVNVSSTVTLSGNKITCSTILTLYVDITIDWVSQTRGYVIAEQNDTVFTLSSVAGNGPDAGMLSISTSSNVTDLTQDTDKDGAYYDGDLDPSWFAKFVTTGTINDYMDQVTALGGSMQAFMDSYDTAVLDVFTNSLGWVFPGAQTYFFENPGFSNNNDLTVQISYQGL